MGSQEENKTEAGTLCPYCGYDTSVNPLPVDEEEVKEYFRRMMAGEPYEKTFKYMKGDIVIRLREISAELTDVLVSLVRKITDNDVVLTYAFRAKFMVSCVEFRAGDRVIIEEPVSELESIEALNELYKKSVGKLPMAIAHIAEDAMSSFSTLVDSALQEAITSKDF